jgi:hypothetical protein
LDVKKTYWAIALLLAVVSVNDAYATVVLQDDFSVPGPVVGSTADIGGTWAQIGANSLSVLTASAGGTVAVTGGTNFQDGGVAFSVPVANTAGTTLYSGLDITLSAAQSGDYFFHLSDPALSSNFYQRLFARSSGAGFQLGIAGGNGTATYGSTVLSFGTTYHVAIGWNFLTGALNDTFNIYVDPTSAVEGLNTPYLANAAWGGGGNPEPTATVSGGNIRQGSGSAMPTLTLDNVVVATTFAEVSAVAVPEASAFLFGGLIACAAGLKCFGRRKSA